MFYSSKVFDWKGEWYDKGKIAGTDRKDDTGGESFSVLRCGFLAYGERGTAGNPRHDGFRRPSRP